jgi:hypothetical protein
MLNMNVYSPPKEQWLFKYGPHLSLGEIALNRFTGGQIKGKFIFLTLISSGTGHWPFRVFGLDFLTGAKAAWQLTVLGLTVGAHTVHDLDPKTGQLTGPDYRKRYWYFSCFNHQNKNVEEVTCRQK